jgi:thioredoxin reductase/Pyruvate/2-oxoacid:ferredoxin oxidoreductase delta subunit
MGNDTLAITALYGGAMALIWSIYGWRRRLVSRRSQALLDDARDAGLAEPASLHPVIDHVCCIGCGSCIDACPEKSVLGLIGGKAHLVTPSACIGHGACARACPSKCITLVFGTEKRGVDIPLLSPEFETSVPGVYIAGELGGMGLIGNAIEQGRQAMMAIAQRGRGHDDRLDVLIVGAGPAGFSAALAAKQAGLSYRVIDQESFGGTVSHFPRGKLVLTRPVELPLVGKVQFRETSKEALLEFWQQVREQHQLQMRFNERMETMTVDGDGFTVATSQAQYRVRSVLLAIGRRGTPRKLEVPGEELPKVVYRLIDAEQYRGQHVLIVGGGDSALEAAWTIAAQPGTQVTLSYRGEAFARAKAKNRNEVQAAQESGKLQVLLESQVREIGAKHVRIVKGEKEIEVANDAVIVCAGGVLPTPFLKSIGIEVETKYGTA